MAIEHLSDQEARDLKGLLDDSLKPDNDDRSEAKAMLRALMRARPATNFKSGHELINALYDKPSHDGITEDSVTE